MAQVIESFLLKALQSSLATTVLDGMCGIDVGCLLVWTAPPLNRQVTRCLMSHLQFRISPTVSAKFEI